MITTIITIFLSVLIGWGLRALLHPCQVHHRFKYTCEECGLIIGADTRENIEGAKAFHVQQGCQR